jgi:hypothetical protein
VAELFVDGGVLPSAGVGEGGVVAGGVVAYGSAGGGVVGSALAGSVPSDPSSSSTTGTFA